MSSVMLGIKVIGVTDAGFQAEHVRSPTSRR